MNEELIADMTAARTRWHAYGECQFGKWIDRAIAALQVPQSEPVAITNRGMGGIEWLVPPLEDDVALYTHPTNKKSLSVEPAPVQAELTVSLEELMSICWRLNDHLRITPQSTVEYEGSQNDIEQFRETLHKIDPMFTHLRGMIAVRQSDIGKLMDKVIAADRALRADGWVMVPREPTPEMIKAGVNAENSVWKNSLDEALIVDIRRDQAKASYSAMIEAAPKHGEGK